VIALIDYKAGNLTSVKKALATLGAEVFVPEAPRDLADARGIIVPGVGHFGATRALDQPWIDAILERVGEGRPLFGICLGMQWLFEGSDEAPDCPGLGVLSGRCYRLGAVRLKPDTTENDARDTRSVRLQPDQDRRQLDQTIKIPHVGWNSLAIRREASIVDGVVSGAQVYFTHSYVAPVTDDTVAVTEHGEPFAAIVQHGQIGGVQFHPEKSGDVGLQILRNFIHLAG
jgi:imidazole glycerol-phosphate synthase subunit HisH